MNIFGIGIDVVEIGKMKELIARYPARIKSIFSPRESIFCANKGPRFSAVFAAKEAALKSLNMGLERGSDLLDIEILPDKKGRFQVKLHRRLGEKAGKLSVGKLMGSFSFAGELAVAQVIALTTYNL